MRSSWLLLPTCPGCLSTIERHPGTYSLLLPSGAIVCKYVCRRQLAGTRAWLRATSVGFHLVVPISKLFARSISLYPP